MEWQDIFYIYTSDNLNADHKDFIFCIKVCLILIIYILWENILNYQYPGLLTTALTILKVTFSNMYPYGIARNQLHRNPGKFLSNFLII